MGAKGLKSQTLFLNMASRQQKSVEELAKGVALVEEQSFRDAASYDVRKLKALGIVQSSVKYSGADLIDVGHAHYHAIAAAQRDLRQRAANLGANIVVLHPTTPRDEGLGGTVRYVGTAYRKR